MDPLQPGRDDLPTARRHHSHARKEDRGGLWAVLGIGAVLLLGIGILHRSDLGLAIPGLDDGMMAAMEGQAAAEGGADASGGRGLGAGARKDAGEPSLKMAEPLKEERYAAPVTHVTETDACRALKNSRKELEAALRKSPGAERKAELDDELGYVMSRGTERGCWSSGAG